MFWFSDEYQQFDVLVVPVKKDSSNSSSEGKRRHEDRQNIAERFVNWIKSLASDSKEMERFKLNAALYFAACVLICCGLPISNSVNLPAPKSLDDLQIVIARERLQKLRCDFDCYLDKTDFSSSTKHEVCKY